MPYTISDAVLWPKCLKTPALHKEAAMKKNEQTLLSTLLQFPQEFTLSICQYSHQDAIPEPEKALYLQQTNKPEAKKYIC